MDLIFTWHTPSEIPRQINKWIKENWVGSRGRQARAWPPSPFPIVGMLTFLKKLILFFSHITKLKSFLFYLYYNSVPIHSHSLVFSNSLFPLKTHHYLHRWKVIKVLGPNIFKMGCQNTFFENSNFFLLKIIIFIRKWYQIP